MLTITSTSDPGVKHGDDAQIICTSGVLVMPCFFNTLFMNVLTTKLVREVVSASEGLVIYARATCRAKL